MKVAVALLASFIALAPVSTQAQTLGRITAYHADPLRTYDADGGRISAATPRSNFPATPTPIVAVRPGGRIGVTDNTGQVVFLRGIDVDFELNDAGRALTECRPVGSSNRASGAVVVGTRAGGGSSTDCVAQ